MEEYIFYKGDDLKMAKIDLTSRSREDFLHWFIISTITDSGKIYEIKDQEGFDSTNLEVKFSVNGIDLPVEETFESINRQLDRMIEEKAVELLNNKLYNFNDLVKEFQDNVNDKIKDIFKHQ